MTTISQHEKDIQYLYGIIEKLEEKDSSSKESHSELAKKLKQSEKLCEEKEKFIAFRESQLLELEEEVQKLKKQNKPSILITFETMASTTSPLTGMSKDELRALITNNINTLHNTLSPRVREMGRPGLLTLKDRTLEALTVLSNKFINDLHTLDENRKREVADEVDRRNQWYNRFFRKRDKKRIWKAEYVVWFNRYITKRDKKRIWKHRYMQIIDAYNRSEEALIATFRRRIVALKLRIAGLQIELGNAPINLLPPQPPVNQIWLSFQ
jgi:hypothetical protein